MADTDIANAFPLTNVSSRLDCVFNENATLSKKPQGAIWRFISNENAVLISEQEPLRLVVCGRVNHANLLDMPPQLTIQLCHDADIHAAAKLFPGSGGTVSARVSYAQELPASDVPVVTNENACRAVYDNTKTYFHLHVPLLHPAVIDVGDVFSKSVGLLPSFIVTFAEPITAILVSSFLTDLRKAADSSTHQHSLTSLGTIEFRVIGSLGASLAAPGVGGVDTEDEGTEETMWSATERASETVQPSSPDSVELKEVA
ncbi:hypothetical protein FKP32DRAFT_1684823 [Trametes sanguinea]|nr:hypothetical protein FKP32DRAFT_1684823 [Trametes sanguinea]